MFGTFLAPNVMLLIFVSKLWFRFNISSDFDVAGNRTVWEFGWAYGVGWGAAIFLFGGVVLLLCDKESEEIYYKERKIVHDSDSRA